MDEKLREIMREHRHDPEGPHECTCGWHGDSRLTYRDSVEAWLVHIEQLERAQPATPMATKLISQDSPDACMMKSETVAAQDYHAPNVDHITDDLISRRQVYRQIERSAGMAVPQIDYDCMGEPFTKPNPDPSDIFAHVLKIIADVKAVAAQGTLCAYCGHSEHLPPNWKSTDMRFDKDTCQWGNGKETCNCPHQIPRVAAQGTDELQEQINMLRGQIEDEDVAMLLAAVKAHDAALKACVREETEIYRAIVKELANSVLGWEIHTKLREHARVAERIKERGGFSYEEVKAMAALRLRKLERKP